jgi:2-oxo-4-hydroxy-4-carboxy-5-ureidoimidazoline decarboxylase
VGVDAVSAFNSLPEDQLADDLTAVLAAPAYGERLLAGRPYAGRDEIAAAGDAAAASLGWADVATALAAHPRIGERKAGDGTDAAWSRREQSTAAETADDETRRALAAVNGAYEERFGHVFLIFATGRSQAEILAAARERLANDDETERAVVTGELRRIARLRLERLLDALG